MTTGVHYNIILQYILLHVSVSSSHFQGKFNHKVNYMPIIKYSGKI